MKLKCTGEESRARVTNFRYIVGEAIEIEGTKKYDQELMNFKVVKLKFLHRLFEFCHLGKPPGLIVSVF